jgi:4-amino-4-deoxy-L-arabinose transferase-like glycosyltransferase
MDFRLLKKEKTILIVIFLLIYAFPVFYKLDKIPMYRWDESLYAHAAFELAYYGKDLKQWDDYFFTGQPNYNTKPPLVFWFQSGFMKIFGYDSKLALRLHSALAAMLTFLLLIYFTQTEFKNILLGLISGMVLVTTHGYLAFHVVRTGDMDSLLIFFTTLMVLFFYKYLKYFDDKKSRNRNLAVFTFALIGGVMTKTSAAFFFLPALLVYAIYKKRLLNILRLRSTYVAIAAFITVIGGYYFIKELATPGTLKHIWEHDLGGRFFTTIHWASHPFYFYIQYLFTSDHTPWIFFIPLSILLFFFIKDEELKDFMVFAAICLVVYLVVISSANTKITWYMSQIYPLFAFIAGFGIYQMLIGLYKLKDKNNSLAKISFLLLFVIAIFFNPYYDTIQGIDSIVKTDKVHMGETYDIYEDCLVKMRNSENSIKEFTVFHEIRDSLMSWNPQLLFYQKVYNKVYGFNIDVTYDPDVLNEGEIVLSNKNSANQVLSRLYYFDVILDGRDSEFIRITGKKSKLEASGNKS